MSLWSEFRDRVGGTLAVLIPGVAGFGLVLGIGAMAAGGLGTSGPTDLALAVGPPDESVAPDEIEPWKVRPNDSVAGQGAAGGGSAQAPGVSEPAPTTEPTPTEPAVETTEPIETSSTTPPTDPATTTSVAPVSSVASAGPAPTTTRPPAQATASTQAPATTTPRAAPRPTTTAPRTTTTTTAVTPTPTTTTATTAPPTTTTPPTTVAPTTSTTEPDDRLPDPFVRTYESRGGTITVEWNGSELALIETNQRRGYETVVKEKGPDRIHVDFEDAGHDDADEERRKGHIEIRLRKDEITVDID